MGELIEHFENPSISERILDSKRVFDGRLLKVDAVDIDEWAEANCRENAAANGLAERIVPMLGDAGRIAGRKYDFIAANINRNILTMDMPAYAEALDTGGDLLMSGFLEEDVPVIEARARACGLDPIEVRMRDGWAMVHVKKA